MTHHPVRRPFTVVSALPLLACAVSAVAFVVLVVAWLVCTLLGFGGSDWLAFGGAIALFAAYMTPVAHGFLQELTRSKRAEEGKCPACGYDLRASSDRCPECGTPIGRPVA